MAKLSHRHSILLGQLMLLCWEGEGAARIMRCSRQTVHAWANGRSRISMETVHFITRRLRLRAEEMCSGDWEAERDRRVDGVLGEMALLQLRTAFPQAFKRVNRVEQIKEAIIDYLIDNQGEAEAVDIIEDLGVQGIGKRSIYNAARALPQVKKMAGTWTLAKET